MDANELRSRERIAQRDLSVTRRSLLAHGWDLAQATEQPAGLPDDLAEQSLAFARTQLTAGLPGADWWVAGGAAASAEDADVELDEVEQFCTERDLWNTLA